MGMWPNRSSTETKVDAAKGERGPSTVQEWTSDVHDHNDAKAGSSSGVDVQMENLPAPATQKKKVRIGQGVKSVHWQSLKKRIGTVSSKVWSDTDSPASRDHSRSSFSVRERPPREEDETPDEWLDEVVVDRLFDEENNFTRASSPDYDAATRSAKESFPRNYTDTESMAKPSPVWTIPLVGRIRGVVWPAVCDFFSPHLPNLREEHKYQHEQWLLGSKRLALIVSLFFIVNWVLGVAFIRAPYVIMDQVWYWGLAPLLSFPVVFFVAYDLPIKRPMLYSVFVAVSVWGWTVYQILSIHLCGFYHGTTPYFSCGDKDFLNTFYYTNALQVVALFGLRMRRLPAAIGALSFIVLAGPLILPYRATWVRNMLNFIFFQAFLLWIHYMSETAERKVYAMRISLKTQHKATQKAQVNEKQASDSKRRLTSYVRVPLNIASLAVQNIAANDAVDASHEEEFSALQSSLHVMAKVLDDVLDFNRMDSGRFETVSRPYAFHQCMRSIIAPLQLATARSDLELVVELDPKIDIVARRAAADVRGLPYIASNGNGIVSGDETRLRQVINNLISNAVKFTPAGGMLTIRTQLLSPETVDESSETDHGPYAGDTNALTMNNLNRHLAKPQQPLRWIVVRIEIIDTGCGIRVSDMAENKLFSAFNQTEVGRQQGGKGTGLGLALVRTIVKLSGGRLGVRSKVGHGSCFWLEIPLGVGAKTMLPPTTFELREQAQASHRSGNHSTANISGRASTLLGKVTTSSEVGSSTRFDAEAAQKSDSGRSSLHLNRTTTLPPQYPQPVLPVQSPQPVQLPPQPNSPRERPTFVALPPPFKVLQEMTGSVDNGNVTPKAIPKPQNRSDPLVPLFNDLPVLVVDDDPLTRRMMSKMLTRLGCIVTIAENGLQALQLIMGEEGVPVIPTPSSELSRPILDDALSVEASSRDAGDTTPKTLRPTFAMVFLDNQMPVMSGVRAVDRLRRERGEVDFVVGVTGNAMLSDQEEYLEAGVDRVLTKPVMQASLVEMLMQADERWKQRSAPEH